MNCPFCNYKKTATLLTFPSVYVIPDFSPLTIGHLLVVSCEHTQSLAGTNNSTILDFKKAISYIEELYSNEEGIFFEHGAVIPSTAGSSIDHTHLHFLPVDIEIESILDKQNCDLNNIIPINDLFELKQFFIRHQSYIYWKRAGSNGFAYPIGMVESQFLRMKIGNMLDQSQDFDWHNDSLTRRAKDLVGKTIYDWNVRRDLARK